MKKPRHSFLAICAVVLNIPWIAGLIWMIDILVHRTGPVAGEVALIPASLYMSLGLVAGCSGLLSLYFISHANGGLQGRWIAISGIAMTASGPLFVLLIDFGLLRVW